MDTSANLFKFPISLYSFAAKIFLHIKIIVKAVPKEVKSSIVGGQI